MGYNTWFDEQSDYDPAQSAVKLGEMVPNLNLQLASLQGEPVNLGQFRDRAHLVLVFGSMT